MDLRAYILGKRYSILQGNTFTEEYNETLDSATIIINNVEKIEDLRPYDDVFIFNFNADFNGYGEGITMPNPYYHFLVDQFTCEQLVLGKNQYKYTIQLFSETKGLEVVQLPNISITQPFKASDKKATIDYINNYVEIYSPVYKKVYDDVNKWYTMARKYTVATTDLGNLKAPSNIFGANDFAPEMTLNNPNLRDILTQLMLTKDCIPVVKDDKIYCMEISKTTGTFDTSKGEINYVIRSRSSDNHCDNLKRTYQNALGQDNTCKYAEYLGFRNSDTGLMTLSNMRLETRFPIYKINKVLMCYYKKVQIVVQDEWVINTYYTYGATVMDINGKAYICIAGHTSSSTTRPSSGQNADNYWKEYYAVFLCKQDISKLVLLNSKREALSQDYDDISNPSGSNVTTIDDLAQYKFCTVGYDIGGNTITGWGTTYSQINSALSWFRYNKSYIENIINNMDKMYPFGIYNYGCIRNLLKENETISIAQYQGIDAIVVGTSYNNNNTVKLKSIFFQIEYDGFFNGTIYHSKDGARDNVVMNDNASGSLTLLEKDGFFEKEKANRFGNEAIQINARYTNLADLQPLGSVYDGNVIIYHREYSHYNNVINCTYYGTKDYVLKNYFTSVYSKHRPFNLLSYGETTTRSENRKRFILLSKDKLYGQPLCGTDSGYVAHTSARNTPLDNKTFRATDFENSDLVFFTMMGSAFNENAKATSKGVFKDEDVIDTAFISAGNLVSKTDLNKFICGKSMCFNLTMYDNLGGGSSLKQIVPTNLEDIYDDQGLNNLKLIFSNVQDDYTGTTTFYNNYNNLDDTTGRVDTLSFMVGHKKYGLRYEDNPVVGNSSEILNNLETDYLKTTNNTDWNVAYGRYGLYRLPNMEYPSSWFVNYTNILYASNYFYKDNKEKLDVTLQLEPVTDNKDIFFSEWFMKLNNLITTYHKTDTTYQVVDSSSFAHKFEGFFGDEAYDTAWNGKKYIPFILMRIPATDYNYVQVGDNLVNGLFYWPMCRTQDFFKYGITSTQPYIQDLKIEPKEIISISPTELKILVDREIHFAQGVFRVVHEVIDTTVMTFTIVSDANSKGYTAGYYTYKWNFEDNHNPFSPPVDGLSLTYDGTTYTFKHTSNTGWFFCKGGGVLPLGNGGISTDEFDIQQMYFSTNSDETTTYNKNMFVAMSTNEIKEGDEEKEYSSYTDIDGFSLTDNVGGRFTVEQDEYIDGHEVPVNHPCIMVNLFDLGTSSNIKSASFYFYDQEKQTYHFVFGVNITQADLERGYIKIYINVLNTRDTRVFGADHLLAGTEKNFANVWENINYSTDYGDYE